MHDAGHGRHVQFTVAKRRPARIRFAHDRATSLASEATNETRFGDGSMFTAIDPPETQSLKPAGVQFWHLWTVIFPRRTITGRLVRGRVWRRHDGRRWQYKKFIEYDQDGE